MLLEDPWLATIAGSVTFIIMGPLGMAVLFVYRWIFFRIQQESKKVVFLLYTTVLLSAIPAPIFSALFGLHGGNWIFAIVIATFFWIFVIVLSTEYSTGDVIRPEKAPDV